MKFEEINFIDITNEPTTFIYFLLQDEEVVYVGQTTKGTARIIAHRDKQFNNVYIIKCTDDELDYLENEFILKYNPIYNKIPNMRAMMRVDKVVHTINVTLKPKKRMNLRRLTNLLKELNITPRLVNHISYIYDWEYELLVEAFYGYKKGEPLSEEFNIWI